MRFWLRCGNENRASEVKAEFSGSIPGIEDGDARLVKVASITRHDRKTVVNCGRGNNQVRLREGVPRFPAVLNHHPPLEHNFFCNLENPSVKHWPNLVRQPIMEQSPAAWIANEFNTKSNLRKSYHAYRKLAKRATSHESYDPCVRIWPP